MVARQYTGNTHNIITTAYSTLSFSLFLTLYPLYLQLCSVANIKHDADVYAHSFLHP